MDAYGHTTKAFCNNKTCISTVPWVGINIGMISKNTDC